MQRRNFTLLGILGCSLAAGLPLGTFAGEDLPPAPPAVLAVDEAGGYPQYRLPQAMLDALPMPMPEEAEALPAEESGRAENRRIVHHDPATGESFVEPASLEAFNLPEEDEAYEGEPWLYAQDPVYPEDSIGIAASQPSPVTATTGYPWRTITKMYMRFGTNSWYVCSAEMLGSFHVQTAAHCIYNHDFPGDEWAREVLVVPAQTDVVTPIGVAEFPYGEARAIWYRTYTGWTQNHDYAHDWAVLTLDRRVGDRVGWMGRSSNVGLGDSLNIAGYPAEKKYGFGGNLFMYHSFDSGNVLCADLPLVCNGRISLSAYTYGGQSGGPVWLYDSGSGNRYIVGTNSTSNRDGFAQATYLSSGKRSDINAWKDHDVVNRPPTDRPDITEYGENHSALLTSSVQEGTTLKADYSVVNLGFAPSGTVDVDFYLSVDTNVTTQDHYLGRHSLGSLADWTFTRQSASLRLPLSIPPGQYHFGWLMRAAATEYSTANNKGVIASKKVTVTACPDDAYEENDSFAAARAIAPGNYRGLRICVDDEDWFYTSVPEGHDLRVTTSFQHAAGNLDLRLYDKNGTLRASSTSSTDGESAALEPVPFAGNYYVRVNGVSHATNAYELSLTLTPPSTGSVAVALPGG
jgi:V8-like Glu-specific endopeptidase